MESLVGNKNNQIQCAEQWRALVGQKNGKTQSLELQRNGFKQQLFGRKFEKWNKTDNPLQQSIIAASAPSNVLGKSFADIKFFRVRSLLDLASVLDTPYL